MPDCRGFTLIEVVVAFAILSISLGVLLEVFAGALRNADLAGRYGQAALLAQSELERLATQGPLVEGVETGEFGGGYRWERLVEPLPVDTQGLERPLAVRPLQVSLRIAWGAGDRSRAVSLSTVVLEAVE